MRNLRKYEAYLALCMCIPVCATKNACKQQTHHHVSPPTFGVDILFLLLYSNLYKGIRSFVLVPWMQHQCFVHCQNWEIQNFRAAYRNQKQDSIDKVGLTYLQILSFVEVTSLVFIIHKPCSSRKSQKLVS